MTKVLFSFLLVMSIVTFNPAFAKQNTDWQLSEDGLGPIKIGMTVAQAEKAAQQKLALEPLGGLGVPVTEACRFAKFKTGPKDISLMLNNRKIVRIDVKNPEIKTTQGAHLGSTTQEIKKLYKGQTTVQPNKYVATQETVTVTPKEKTNSRLIFFGNDKNIIDMISAGRLPEVEYVEGCG